MYCTYISVRTSVCSVVTTVNKNARAPVSASHTTRVETELVPFRIRNMMFLCVLIIARNCAWKPRACGCLRARAESALQTVRARARARRRAAAPGRAVRGARGDGHHVEHRWRRPSSGWGGCAERAGRRRRAGFRGAERTRARGHAVAGCACACPVPGCACALHPAGEEGRAAEARRQACRRGCRDQGRGCSPGRQRGTPRQDARSKGGVRSFRSARRRVCRHARRR